MKIISRPEAITLGAKSYFTGKPCKHGHIALRQVAAAVCRECDRLRRSTAEKTEKYREYMRNAQRKYRAKHPDRVKAYEHNNKDKAAARSRKWQAENPEKRKASWLKYHYENKAERLEQNRNWRLANPERVKELMRAWKSANPERWRELMRVGAQNRRALEKKAEGRITRDHVISLFELQGGCCASVNCCANLSGGFHLDHIVPLSRSGTNKLDNIQLLCAPCNLSKGRKTMEEWEALKLERAA